MHVTAGCMAVVSGKVIHVTKCVPTELSIKHGEESYNQVERNNETYFLNPRTHILLKNGMQVNCNPMILSYYNVGFSWYQISSKPVYVVPPTIINPQTEKTWQYNDPVDFGNSGIYTTIDLGNLSGKYHLDLWFTISIFILICFYKNGF